jgi:hypothetical protein
LPEKLAIRWASGQATASGLLVLRSKEDGKAFEIEKVECDSKLVKTKFAVGQGIGSVRATLDTKDLKSGEAELKITIKDPQPRVIKIPISWECP